MPNELCRTPINGVFQLQAQPFADHRGAFLNAFRAQDLTFMSSWGDRGITQVNLSRTEAVGTIGGLHLQAEPHSEAKLVSCLRGLVWDAAVDLRQHSVTYGHWHALELSPGQFNTQLIPVGCAHGFQVLEPGSQLLYLHSGPWEPKAETGVCWVDPQLAIAWPLQAGELSDRDRGLPLLSQFKVECMNIA